MVEGIVYLLNGIATLIWAVGICQVEIRREKIRWFMSGISFIGILIISRSLESETKKLFLNIILILIGYWVIAAEDWNRKIVIFLFSLFYETVVTFLVKAIIKILELICKNSLIYKEVFQGILEIFVIIIISCLLRKKKNWVKWIKNISVKYYFFGFLCAFSASGITVYIEMQITKANHEMQLIIMLLTAIVNVFFYGMGIGIVIIDLLREHYKEENILKDEYLYLSKQHYSSILENMIEVRSLKHDMKTHLNVMAHLVERKQWNDLQRYIESAKDVVDKSMGRFVNVNHDLVNAILTERLADEEDIKFQYDGTIPNNIQIEDFDLCTIFSNLIANSIEACYKIKDLKKEIVLQIKRFQKNLYIYIENPVQESIDINELEKKTSKKDKKNHGYGVFNIVKTVKKYEGEITFQCKNNRFSVEVIFFDVIK